MSKIWIITIDYSIQLRVFIKALNDQDGTQSQRTSTSRSNV